jgi:hypothetical protein
MRDHESTPDDNSRENDLDDEFQLPSWPTLPDFAFESAANDGVQVDSLTPGTKVRVQTRNSEYWLTVLEGGSAGARAGRHSPAVSERASRTPPMVGGAAQRLDRTGRSNWCADRGVSSRRECVKLRRAPRSPSTHRGLSLFRTGEWLNCLPVTVIATMLTMSVYRRHRHLHRDELGEKWPDRVGGRTRAEGAPGRHAVETIVLSIRQHRDVRGLSPLPDLRVREIRLLARHHVDVFWRRLNETLFLTGLCRWRAVPADWLSPGVSLEISFGP